MGETHHYSAQIWHAQLTRDRTVLPATHTFIHKWNEPPAFTPQPQSVTALWPVLIFRPAEDRRLSWPGCLVNNRGDLPARRRSPTASERGSGVDDPLYQRAAVAWHRSETRQAISSRRGFSSLVKRNALRASP